MRIWVQVANYQPNYKKEFYSKNTNFKRQQIRNNGNSPNILMKNQSLT